MDMTVQATGRRAARTTERHAGDTPSRRGAGLYATREAQSGPPRDSSPRRGLSPLEVTMIIVLVVAVVVATVMSRSSSVSGHTGTDALKVRPGQTLWSIAAENPIPGLTTQQTIDVIRHANGLTGSALAAGSVITVPAPVRADVALAR